MLQCTLMFRLTVLLSFIVGAVAYFEICLTQLMSVLSAVVEES